MGNENLRFLTDDQKRQLNNIVVMIQMSSAIPENKKFSEIQKATEQFLTKLKKQGELAKPEAERNVLAGILDFKPNNKKPVPVKNNQIARLDTYKGPIMLQ